MRIKHGLTKTPIYRAWLNMKARCDNPKSPDYKHYGERGISYPSHWGVFEGFYSDMSATWSEGLTLDRIDVNNNYSKENCRWVNRYVQSINRTNTLMLEYNGLKMTLSDWARTLGKKRSTLSMRHYVYGWDIKRTLST